MNEERETTPAGGPPAALGRDEVRRRATGGAMLLVGRGALVFGIGIVVNVVLARLLEPREFGLVAFGTTLMIFGTTLSEAGLAAALLRRRDEPTREELEAALGLQLGVTAVLAAAFAGGASLAGRDGLVVAAMVASLPITTFRTPSSILLERRLEYRPIATVDIVEAWGFYAWSVTTVVLGMGVWGVASGMWVRALAGTATMARVGPAGLVRPRWSWPLVRPLVAFGVRLQGVNVAVTARDQAINLGVAAVAGVATLGIWNLAWRVLQIPNLVFGAIGRVWYPAMSRLLEADADPSPVIRRGAETAVVATAAVLVPVVGFAPAMPAVVGAAWEGLPATLLWSSVALVGGAPIWLIVVGYLYAVDAPGVVLRVVPATVIAWFGVGLPLVADIGAPGVGIGWIASSIVSSLMLLRAVARRSGADVARSLAVPTLIALLAFGAAWAVGSVGEASVPWGVLGALVGEIGFVVGLALTRRTLLRGTYALLAGALRRA